MKSEDWVAAALRALEEHDREREAPEEIETRLLAAFRRRHARRKTKTAALDCPVGTVRSRLSRGRAMLARKLRGVAVV